MVKKTKKSADSEESTSATKSKKEKSSNSKTEEILADSIDIDVYDEQASGPTISIRTVKD